MKIRALAAIGAAAAAAPHRLRERLRTSAPATQAAAPQTLTVLAAASLTETFTALGKQFETDHPGVSVKFNYAGSSDLAQQIVNGAPGRRLRRRERRHHEDRHRRATSPPRKPVTFAKNVLQIATPPGNPKKIATFADLAKPDVKVVVCAPQVPCGAAAQKIEKATGITLKPVSEEADVKSVLSKVQTGDADAGLVYVTDVNSAGDKVQGVTSPRRRRRRPTTRSRCSRTPRRPTSRTSSSPLVTGEQGQKALEQAGFAKP